MQMRALEKESSGNWSMDAAEAMSQANDDMKAMKATTIDWLQPLHSSGKSGNRGVTSEK